MKVVAGEGEVIVATELVAPRASEDRIERGEGYFEESFEDFYRSQLRPLTALAYALAGRSNVAEDIAQEALLAVYRHWNRFGPGESAARYARRVVANRAAGMFRRFAVQARGALRLGGASAEGFDVGASTAEFWSMVRDLPRRQRQVTALHYLEDFTVADIAATLGVAEGTVKAHLAAARDAIARHLREDQR